MCPDSLGVAALFGSSPVFEFIKETLESIQPAIRTFPSPPTREKTVYREVVHASVLQEELRKEAIQEDMFTQAEDAPGVLASLADSIITQLGLQ